VVKFREQRRNACERGRFGGREKAGPLCCAGQVTIEIFLWIAGLLLIVGAILIPASRADQSAP
jgi:hypothetical protein